MDGTLEKAVLKMVSRIGGQYMFSVIQHQINQGAMAEWSKAFDLNSLFAGVCQVSNLFGGACSNHARVVFDFLFDMGCFLPQTSKAK